MKHAILLLPAACVGIHTAELPLNVKKKKSASFKYKLIRVLQPIMLVVRIILLVTLLKQLSEFYFLSNLGTGSL